MQSDAVGEGGVAVAPGRTIAAVRLCGRQRLNCLPRQFGPWSLAVETMVYDTMRRLCGHYEGGCWDFVALSNGGLYMAPQGAERWYLACAGNGYEGWFASDAAGLAVCAMAYSRLSFERGGARMAEAFYLLRDFIGQHAEARRLLALLD